MNGNIFDGNVVAKEKEMQLKREVKRLKDQGKIPKIVSIFVGGDSSSKLYLRLKKKAAERVGCKLSIISYPSGPGQRQFSTNTQEIINKIQKLSTDESIHGIMIQLPLPRNFSKSDRDKIIDTIAPEKDVDGMRDDSLFVAPVVQAVSDVVSMSEEWFHCSNYPIKLVIVGSKGFVGKKILKYYLVTNKQSSYFTIGVDVDTPGFKKTVQEADILVSATGVPNLIKPDMVKNNVVLIDVGAPKGDIDKAAYKKASFVSPVPGGIGPLTIAYLLENLVQSVKN